MSIVEPACPEELAEALGAAAGAGRAIALGGGFSKQAMGGPLSPAEVTICTRRLNRVLQYDPRDLTISVEAGMSFAELNRLLAGHGQMAPLDPFLPEQATVGGVLAANISGPRRRLYGTARDMLIGMKFATVEGKLVESGGMVVKNVAGLDLGRLMIGSFGTLAAIVSANFRLSPIPPAWRTFLRAFPDLSRALEARDAILRGVLQPAALDLLNPPASARLGREGFLLALEAGGSQAVLERCARELPQWQALEAREGEAFWRGVREFTPDFLRACPQGAVVRVASSLAGLGPALETLDQPAVARAGSGLLWGYFNDCEAAGAWVRQAAERGWKAVIEFAPPERKPGLELWPAPGGDLAVMQRVKAMFDPRGLLNRGRLYGRI